MTRAMIFASGLPLTFWGDAAEYSTYIMNRSPTNLNPKRASPLEVLTNKSPDLRNIVVFGSHCTVYRDPSKNTFARRAQVGTIVGCSDETKGFRVFIRKENKVITTQHVKNIETLSEAQNRQLQLALDDDGRADSDEGTETPVRQSSSITASEKPKKKKQWTRQPHVTRGAAKKAAATNKK
ncbi:unnamed protein product [Hyaloperonospora brassicae]|uniref:Retroviral polymerase SH3-like domain-containing protein n=1 Tax=Hyaloperonospora brassicae TaxID=162125 RepID=A0AAV0TRC0_HYABA|nr:unnamed protein product [Hyaloperonospora brassicae]